uniref:F5/8 type C domain-containing protein n=1 Tax=Labrus bergylta TaxID=56723 RepID=A0A3Q3N6S0_9LABR
MGLNFKSDATQKLLMHQSIFWLIFDISETDFKKSLTTNIAKGGKVDQSSLYGKGVPERAIDGNRASKWGDDSCTHTHNDFSPWWRLDLQKQYKITSVTITNRRDCCHDRINGAEIPTSTFNFMFTLICNGMEGRYVTIVIPNKKQYLTLCEVEVTGETTGNTPVIGGKVDQSSLYGKGVPERAIDGNRASKWGDDSCTHTHNDFSPWWRLDLQKQYKITSVTITNRRDCCHDRINGAEIHIGDSLNDNGNSNPICAKISSIAAGASKTFQCNGMEGRYVTIVIPNKKQYLTLCEVEVTGETTGNTPVIGDLNHI